MTQPELFVLPPSRRRLTKRERAVVCRLIRSYLYRDVLGPVGDDLVVLKEALEKLKPLRKKQEF